MISVSLQLKYTIQKSSQKLLLPFFNLFGEVDLFISHLVEHNYDEPITVKELSKKYMAGILVVNFYV